MKHKTVKLNDKEAEFIEKLAEEAYLPQHYIIRKALQYYMESDKWEEL